MPTNTPPAAYPPPTMPAPYPPARRRGGYVLAYVGGLATAVVVLVAVAFTAPGLLDKLTTTTAGTDDSGGGAAMHGTMTMPRWGVSANGASWEPIETGEPSCVGRGGYDDMAAGASVTVYDDTGKIVGSGRLHEGVQQGKGVEAACVWSFDVSNLPDVDFYAVEVSHRGKITVKREDLNTVALSLR